MAPPKKRAGVHRPVIPPPPDVEEHKKHRNYLLLPPAIQEMLRTHEQVVEVAVVANRDLMPKNPYVGAVVYLTLEDRLLVWTGKAWAVHSAELKERLRDDDEKYAPPQKKWGATGRLGSTGVVNPSPKTGTKRLPKKKP